MKTIRIELIERRRAKISAVRVRMIYTNLYKNAVQSLGTGTGAGAGATI
jgi:hypothetical protein